MNFIFLPRANFSGKVFQKKFYHSLLTLVCGAGLLCVTSGRAANFTTSNTQPAGQNWNGAIWVPEGGGAAVAPSPGNTYTVLSNASAIFNLSTNARVRNPTATGTQTFLGDSLTLTTNTEIRFKIGPTLINLPGVAGNPGLIVDGGVLNLADNGIYSVTGVVQVASTMYIDAVNDHGGALQPSRGLNLLAQLTGSGTVAIFQSTTNTPHTIANNSNTFNGKWIVTSGRLLGKGTNSLGTNNITIDPFAPLGLDPSLPIVPGPATLEVNYDLNSAGTLTLANGGKFRLHQNCAFPSAIIEGTPLSAGTHYYDELFANFPNNFDPGGSGAITVQPYGTLPNLLPIFLQQPKPKALYAGATARFSVSMSGQVTQFHWQKDGGNLSDGGNISGSTTASLTVSNIDSSSVGNYSVVVANSSGSVTSSVAALTLVTPGTYDAAVLSANPVAYYPLNETSDPANNAPAFDPVNGNDGTYGVGAQNGNPNFNILGPQAGDGFSGFDSGNTAAAFFRNAPASFVTIPALNLNTNTVTMVSWINPVGPQNTYNGLIFSRTPGSIGGFHYSSTFDPTFGYTLGYNWNDEGTTFAWNSGIAAPQNMWSMIALVVRPTNATIYVFNANGLSSATFVHDHVNLAFNGPMLIGGDSLDGGTGSRSMTGSMDSIAIFNRSLTQDQLSTLYGAAGGAAVFQPNITVQPTNALTLYTGQTATLSVQSSGTLPLNFQWQSGASGSGSFTDLTESSYFNGTKTATLTFSNVQLSAAGDYRVVVTNSAGSLESSIATITVLQAGPPLAITLSEQQPLGLDWNTGTSWSDGNPASFSAVANPGSTYEVVPPGRVRSPDGAAAATFPGETLTISGDGIYSYNGASGTIGEIRFKQGAPNGRVRFKKLKMNGGQMDITNPDSVVMEGEIDILANTPIYNDTALDRGARIEAQLTGSANIEYHAYNLPTFNSAFIQSLNVAGTSNTFSGKWTVALGVLLGTGPNSLGTNDITIGTEGAFETTYDINNPNSTLTVNGRMFLHQNDTFKNVIVNGVSLTAGTYTFSQLNASYPTSFPASWTAQIGSGVSAGSGSITVLGNRSPSVAVNFQHVGSDLQISWPQGVLEEAPDVTGPWTTNSVVSPVTVTPTGARKFFRVKVQ